MTRRKLDLNPQDYAIHYRPRRWSATLIIAKTLRWFAARARRSARRSGAVSTFHPRRTRRPGRALVRMVRSIRRARGTFQPTGAAFRQDSAGRYHPLYPALLLIALLGAAAPAFGKASQRRDHRESESSSAEPVAPTRTPGWGFELFARGGFAGIPANGEVLWTGTVLAPPAPFDLQFITEADRPDRTPAWGAGFRAMRGRWGFETQYLRMTTGAFQPGSLIDETALNPLRELASGGQPEDLLIAQGIFQFRIRADGTRLFVGFGAGYLRFPTLDTSRRDEILLTDFYAAEVEPDLQRSLSNSLTLQEERTGRYSFLVAGSAGLTLETRWFFVRPRLDVLLGRTRETAATWGAGGEFDLPEVGRQWIDLGTESVEVSGRPLFVLFSVDLGWAFRR